MNYNTTFKRYPQNKELDRPKKVLLKSLEQFRNENATLESDSRIQAFKDDDEMYMYLNDVKVETLPHSYMGKAFDISEIGEKSIIIIQFDPTTRRDEFGLWIIDRVLNYNDDPEYFI